MNTALSRGFEPVDPNRMPKVSIGLPVFNGEIFLEEALDSILSQTYQDFELTIVDNASIDRTGEIATAFASRDERVRYYRNESNLGASRNYNRTFELSSGQYFKWAAHDDLLAPDYLAKCAEVLDRDPLVVLCHSKAKVIDEEGGLIEHYDPELRTASPLPRDRFHDVIWANKRCYEAFGLIRSEVLKRTSLIGNYPASDRVLLAELSLLGRMHQIDEYLFCPRKHEAQFMTALTDRHAQAAWFDPKRKGKVLLPKWTITSGYLRAIRRAPLTLRERAACYRLIGEVFLINRRQLLKEPIDAAKQVLNRSTTIGKLAVQARRNRA
jgi:glycosyltransferase involved in cell wall biosynthesis